MAADLITLGVPHQQASFLLLGGEFQVLNESYPSDLLKQLWGGHERQLAEAPQVLPRPSGEDTFIKHKSESVKLELCLAEI